MTDEPLAPLAAIAPFVRFDDAATEANRLPYVLASPPSRVRTGAKTPSPQPTDAVRRDWQNLAYGCNGGGGAMLKMQAVQGLARRAYRACCETSCMTQRNRLWSRTSGQLLSQLARNRQAAVNEGLAERWPCGQQWNDDAVIRLTLLPLAPAEGLTAARSPRPVRCGPAQARHGDRQPLGRRRGHR